MKKKILSGVFALALLASSYEGLYWESIYIHEYGGYYCKFNGYQSDRCTCW